MTPFAVSLRFLRPCLAVLVCCVGLPASAEEPTFEAGKTYWDAPRYVEYRVGDAPLILSAPHGGRLAPESIPDRTEGVLNTDTNTDVLAADFAAAFEKRTGRQPYLVICHLKRIKVDCNREEQEGTAGQSDAVAAWRAFHGYIDHARRDLLRTQRTGLYLDLHAHAHPDQRIEIGYLLNNQQLKSDDDALNKLAPRSSIRTLAARDGASFAELIRGPTSFGGLLQQRGYPSVPSPAFPHTGDAKYFNGGFDTARYGPRDGGLINGFQLECNYQNVRDTKAHREAFAAALADAVVEYLHTHAQLDLAPAAAPAP